MWSSISDFSLHTSVADTANALILSRIMYAIQVWGSCPTTWVKKVQVVQNSAARFALRKSRRTLVNVLLTECSWLLVPQMIVYHLLLLLWKMLRGNYPLNMMLRIAYWPGDLLSTLIRRITRASWSQRSVLCWNSMPPQLRAEQNLKQFKKILLQWTLNSIEHEVSNDSENKNEDNH